MELNKFNWKSFRKTAILDGIKNICDLWEEIKISM